MWIIYCIFCLSFPSPANALPIHHEADSAIREFKQSRFLDALKDPFPRGELNFKTRLELEKKDASIELIPFCLTAWTYFLDSMTYHESAWLRPNIVSWLHRSFTSYIEDYSNNPKQREWLEKKSRETGTFQCFEDAALHLIDRIYDWLEGYEITEVCFFPSAFFDLNGGLKRERQEQALWRKKYRDRILAQFGRALRLAGPLLALNLREISHWEQALKAPESYFSESFLLFPQGSSMFERGKRMLLYKVFQNIYGTYSHCAAICQKPKGLVLEKLARAVHLQFIFVNVVVDFDFVSVIFDEWMRERGDAVALFKSSLHAKTLEIPPKVPKSFRSSTFLQMLAWVSVYSLRTYMDTSISTHKLDPVTWRYSDLTDTEVLVTIQRDGLSFFQYLYPVLLKWKDSIEDIFDQLGLQDEKKTFTQMMELASKTEKKIHNPLFRWTLKLENKYPLQIDTCLNQMTKGCSTNIELPLLMWLPKIQSHVEKMSEVGQEETAIF